MKNIHRIHLIIQQFKTAKEASMGLASCLTAAFIISLMGCSLDISRYFLADHQLNQTIKAAALAAVKEINPRKRQAILSAYESSNWAI